MIKRDVDNALIFGVCAGLAKHFDISTALVRVLTILGVIFTGSILFWAYIIAAILMPKEA